MPTNPPIGSFGAGVTLCDKAGNVADINSSGQYRVEVAAIPPVDVSGNVAATDVLHASAQETADGQTTDRDFSRYRHAKMVVDLTAFTTNVTFYFEAKDPLSGKYFEVWKSAVLAAAGTHVIWFTDQSAANETAPTNFTYYTRLPLEGTTYRLRWDLTGNCTFSAYIILKA